MRLSTLKGKPQDLWLVVPGEEEKIHIVYNPGELTLEVADEMRAAMDAGLGAEVVAAMLRRLLVSWDLQDEVTDPETGKVTLRQLTTSEEDIKKVPLPFFNVLLEAITNDSRPNGLRGEISEDGSPQTEQQGLAPNGTSSSGQRTGSLVSPGSS